MEQPDPVKFLLVDDLDENLRALEALLRRDGLELHKARSGVEALEFLLQHDFSLALLDVQMPDMDGFELAELMRGMERTRHVPIVFISAVATDEGRRFRGYEAGAVDYVLKPLDPIVLKSKASVFFDIGRQHHLLASQRQELMSTASRLKVALDRLQAHTDNSPLAIAELDAELRLLTWSKGAERMFGWTAAEMVGARLPDLGWVPEEKLAELATMFSATLPEAADRRVIEHMRCRHKQGSFVECEWYTSILHDGKALSLNVQILDVTERRRAEETQRLLVGELSHRVKNTLASVQAIASQTLRHTRSPDQFGSTFSGRIQSLARAHSMLSETNWQGAGLLDLVRDQLKLGTIDAQRIEVAGSDIQLAPQEALRLALALHELSTNASKYGAFSNATGRVILTWKVADARLQLRWQEGGGPLVRVPSKRGFGSALIEGSFSAEGGSATVSYRPDGVVWDITMPLAARALQGAIPERNSGGPLAVPASSAAAGHLDGRSLLVVEDESLVALDIISILTDAGAVVHGPATTVEEALRSIEEASFDAALLDGNLHGRPVDQVVAALRGKRIPFLFVSGYGSEHLPAAFGSIAVLSKPFTPTQLLDAVARLAPKLEDNVVSLGQVKQGMTIR